LVLIWNNIAREYTVGSVFMPGGAFSTKEGIFLSKKLLQSCFHRQFTLSLIYVITFSGIIVAVIM
jgi:hypothetical protein